MLTANGILVVASPYTWRPEYTPLENWIGGFQKVHFRYDYNKCKLIPGIKNCFKIQIMHKFKNSLIIIKDAENHFTVDGLKETLMPDLVLLQELKVCPDQLLILWPGL